MKNASKARKPHNIANQCRFLLAILRTVFLRTLESRVILFVKEFTVAHY